MSPAVLRVVAMASLAGLMASSVTFVFAPFAGPSPGIVLAAVKLLALGLLMRRVARAAVYAMQWSSMFILLFVAEGLVRATSDPQPAAAAGGVEALFGTVYFVAVLAILAPLKKAARRPRS